jgi:hypothetical protein
MSSPLTPTCRGNRTYHAYRRHNRRRRYASLVVGSMAALTLAGTANAAEPIRTTETLHRRIDASVTCPDFDITGEFDITREITTFTDQDGVAVRRIIHADITGTFTNASNGESLPTSGVRVFHFDLLTGEAFSTGSNNVTRLPDGGVSNAGTGQLVFDSQGRLIESHGPPFGEFDELCAALAT